MKTLFFTKIIVIIGLFSTISPLKGSDDTGQEKITLLKNWGMSSEEAASFVEKPQTFPIFPDKFFHEDWNRYLILKMDSSGANKELMPYYGVFSEKRETAYDKKIFAIYDDASTKFIIRQYPSLEYREEKPGLIIYLKEHQKGAYTLNCLEAIGSISCSEVKDRVLYEETNNLNKLREALIYERRNNGIVVEHNRMIDRFSISGMDEALSNLEKSICILEKTNSIAFKEYSFEISQELANELLEFSEIISNAAEPSPTPEKTVNKVANFRFFKYDYTGKEYYHFTIDSCFYSKNSICFIINKYSDIIFEYMKENESEKVTLLKELRKTFALLKSTQEK